MKMYVKDGKAVIEKEYINSYQQLLCAIGKRKTAPETVIQTEEFTFQELINKRKEIENDIKRIENNIRSLNLAENDEDEYKSDRYIQDLEYYQDELIVVEKLLGLF